MQKKRIALRSIAHSIMAVCRMLASLLLRCSMVTMIEEDETLRSREPKNAARVGIQSVYHRNLEQLLQTSLLKGIYPQTRIALVHPK